MRPRGEVRQALSEAAQVLADERGQATWRHMAARAGVGFAKAKRTVEDMAKAGELTPVGRERMPHARKPLVAYTPARSNWATQTTGPLDNVMRAWSR